MNYSNNLGELNALQINQRLKIIKFLKIYDYQINLALMTITNTNITKDLKQAAMNYDRACTLEYESIKKYLNNLNVRLILQKLFLAANQQFCFWIDIKDQKFRPNYTSELVDSLVYSEEGTDIVFKFRELIINNAVTFRKERLDLLKENFKYCISNSHLVHSNFEFLTFLYKSDSFQDDFFAKKREYFLMSVYRYFKTLSKIYDQVRYFIKDKKVIESLKSEEIARLEDFIKFYDENKEFINEVLNITINPCIDYQIPKMLQHYASTRSNNNIFGNEITEKINNHVPIQKDSYDEIKIRSISYGICLGLEKYGSQELIDSILFNQRHNAINKHHECLTTSY